MKIKLFKEIEIPQGMEASVNGNVIMVKGDKGEIKKKLNVKSVDVEIKGGKIIIGNERASKKEKRLINTYAAHIRNMINGLGEEFEYKLKIVYSHFPMTVELHGHEAIVKNFLGEKIPRKLKILKGVNVNIDKENITVKSHDRELAGQTAANFEVATKIRNRDRRVFQDGIFITNKPGREI
nr:50S ribosomal protein L6P [uncultured archaeon]